MINFVRHDADIIQSWSCCFVQMQSSICYLQKVGSGPGREGSFIFIPSAGCENVK